MPEGNIEIVETGVDALLKIIREKGRVSLSELAKQLNTSSSVVQSWVDFLVEEGILGIEYKFITPYVYLNKKKQQQPASSAPKKDTLQMKDEFYTKAAAKNLSIERTNILWKQYIEEHIPAIRDEFMARAKEKNVPQDKLEPLWNAYKIQLLQSR